MPIKSAVTHLVFVFSYDNNVLASRGGDDTLKTWDIRNFKKPLNEASGLFNLFPV